MDAAPVRRASMDANADPTITERTVNLETRGFVEHTIDDVK
jgi:hypothetical protein